MLILFGIFLKDVEILLVKWQIKSYEQQKA